MTLETKARKAGQVDPDLLVVQHQRLAQFFARHAVARYSSIPIAFKALEAYALEGLMVAARKFDPAGPHSWALCLARAFELLNEVARGLRFGCATTH
jgi:hypothetical protein